jgi:hypothetical protein
MKYLAALLASIAACTRLVEAFAVGRSAIEDGLDRRQWQCAGATSIYCNK